MWLHNKFQKNKYFQNCENVWISEVPVNVVDLGLIYGVDVSEKNDIDIKMTMTTRGCPLHDTLVSDVKKYLNKIDRGSDQLMSDCLGSTMVN